MDIITINENYKAKYEDIIDRLFYDYKISLACIKDFENDLGISSLNCIEVLNLHLEEGIHSLELLKEFGHITGEEMVFYHDEIIKAFNRTVLQYRRKHWVID